MKISTRNIVVVVALLGLAIGWWLWRSGADEGTADSQAQVAAAASASGRAGGKGSDLAGKKLLNVEVPSILDAPKAAIAGTVRDQEGNPVASAQVCAFLNSDDIPADKRTPCATTAADGRYRIDGLYGSGYLVSASAPGHIPNQFEKENERQSSIALVAGKERVGVDIVLKKGGVEVRGIVSDIAGGVIEGAEVRTGAFWWGSSPPALARSDEDGKFSVWVKEGGVHMKAKAEGYAESDRSGRAPGTTFELFLTPESVVAGRVVHASTGEPVEGAKVDFGGWKSERGITDANGRFRIEGLSPGRYKPKAVADGGYGESATSVHLGVGESTEEVLIEVHPAITVTADVVIGEGKDAEQCPKGSVRLKRLPRRNDSVQITKESTHSESIVLRGVLPGRYEVYAGCEGHLSEAKYPELEVGTEPIDGLVYRVSAGLAIRGRVIGDAEQIAEARVSTRTVGGDPRAQSSFSGDNKLGPDGEFELRGLSKGKYEVNLYVEGVPPAKDPLEVDVNDEDIEGLELEIEEAGKVRGRVEDPSGNPIVGASVRAKGPRSSWRSAYTDDDGRFELDGLAAGEFRVTASKNSTTLRKPGTTDDDVQGEAVEVTTGETTDVTIVVEQRNATLSGKVMDEEGNPVTDAFVRAERQTDSKTANASRKAQSVRWGGWNEKPVLTDEDGSFTIEGLGDGDFAVRAWRRGGGEGTLEDVASNSDGIVIEIESTGRLEGQIVTSAGKQPKRFKVAVRNDESGFSRSESFFETGGSFVLDQLPPGKYMVRAEAEEGMAELEVELGLGEIKQGIKLEMTRLVAVKGKVVDLESGEPAVGLVVSISPRKGGFSFNFDSGGEKRNVTDENGEYELDAVPTGKVMVTLIEAGFGSNSKYGFSSLGATVGEGDPYTMATLEVAEKRIKGREVAGDLGLKMKETDAGTDWVDHELIVGFVRPGGPAQKAGIKMGDVIVSVDGHDVRGENVARYRRLTHVLEGTELSIGLGDERTVTVKAGKKP